MRVIAALVAATLAACSAERDATPAAADAAPLEWATAQMREVDLAWTAEAVLEAGRQSSVAAQIAGRVVEVRVDAGDAVRKGEVLVRLDERPSAHALEASEAQVREAQAALAHARLHYERSRQLLARQFISAAAFDRAEAEFRQAQARLAAMLAGAGAAATERGFATVVAPYAGVVSARHVEVGDMAMPGKPLLTTFDPTTLRAVATVPQSRLAEIRASPRARIEIPALGRSIEARSLSVIPAADPRTHTTRVRLDLPADVRGVHPGLYARVHFTVGRAVRLLVPREAVLRRSELVAVYVDGGAGRPLLRQVRLGAAGDETHVEVLAGLAAGERVARDPVRAGLATRRTAP